MNIDIQDYPLTRHFTSIGRCIYCGRPPEEVGALTDEHIIPLALQGTLIFDNASCVKCAKHINSFETFCLRTMLLDARRTMGLHGRKHKKSPQPQPRIGRFDEVGNFKAWEGVSFDNDPYFAVLPTLAPPTIIINEAPQNGFVVDGYWLHSSPSSPRKLHEAGPGAAKVQMFDPDHFGRFLIKIGHGIAIAEMGWDTFDHFLRDPILGTGTYPSHFVGCILSTSAPATKLHELAISRVDNFVVVDIRLFAKFGGPTYSVIVGAARTPSADRHQQVVSA